MVVSKWLTVVVFQNPQTTEIDSFLDLGFGTEAATKTQRALYRIHV